MDSLKEEKVKKVGKYVFPASYAKGKEQIAMIRKADEEVIVFPLSYAIKLVRSQYKIFKTDLYELPSDSDYTLKHGDLKVKQVKRDKGKAKEQSEHRSGKKD